MSVYRIAVVTPGGRIAPEVAERTLALAALHYPNGAVEIHFHPQCFAKHGHFAGDDEVRIAAFVEAANSPNVDAVWFGRGGYGAGRMAQAAIERLGPAAGDKTYLGYSDTGALLGALYEAKIGRPVHGPMPGDIRREGGEVCVLRSLSYLVDGDPMALEGGLGGGVPHLAYNMAVLSSVLGTPLEPTFKDHVLMLEEVGEYMYRTDRFLFQITSTPSVRQAAGIRLGRVSGVPENDPDFLLEEEAVMRHWCDVSGIPYLGRADIGHDIANKVVPFGT